MPPSTILQGIGSSPDGSTLDVVRCVSFSEDFVPCTRAGTATCASCFLVNYCSKQCQKNHWVHHKIFCKSPLSKDNWKPAWEAQDRPPAFISNFAPSSSSYWNGMCRHLWGNVPAFDIVRLSNNEGINWRGDLNLLFAASGDLRNVIMSVNCLPSNFQGTVNMVINDRDEFVSLRNVVMLLIFSSFDPEEAAEMVIHFWYSASLTMNMKLLIDQLLAKLITKLRSVKSPRSTDVFVEQFHLSRGSNLRAGFSARQWAVLMNWEFLELDAATATKNRRDIVLAPHRADYRDRQTYQMKVYHRVSKARFRKNGLLLPFGAATEHFTEPNCFLYNACRTNPCWLLNDSADPLEGWNIQAVLQAGDAAELPANDLYGALFFYLKSQFTEFAKRISTLNLQFTIMGEEAMILPAILSSPKPPAKPPVWRPQKFDRIEVSNLADACWTGVTPVLRKLGPLLKDTNVNPHATLITLFLNYPYDHTPFSTTRYIQESQFAVLQAQNVFPVSPSLGPHDPYRLALAELGAYFKDFELAFSRYERVFGLKEVGRGAGLMKRDMNRVIARWPFGLKKGVVKKVVRRQIEDFALSGLVGHECFVEWTRR